MRSVSDDLLHNWVARHPNDPQALAEMRLRVERALVRAMPSPEATCAHGRIVRLDDKGAYSSAYWYHISDNSTCFERDPIPEPPSPRKARMQAMLDSI
jgi:hypothetical protein